MHGRHNVNFEVQFYSRGKNSITDASDRRLCIPALMYTKGNQKKI